MSDVTEILWAIDSGDPQAAQELLPLVYRELRKLAAAKLAHEKPGRTLQATALVHKAYLRLVGKPDSMDWNSRGHFFGAAAEAMRRILIEQARRKQRDKHGGGRRPASLNQLEVADDSNFASRKAPLLQRINDGPSGSSDGHFNSYRTPTLGIR